MLGLVLCSCLGMAGAPAQGAAPVLPQPVSPPKLFETWLRYQTRSALGGLGIQMDVGDLDADGDVDIVFPEGVLFRLLFNEGGGTFRSVTTAFPLTPGSGLPSGVALGDIDGDGDIDVVVPRIGPVGQSLVYLNDGRGQLTLTPIGQRLPGQHPSLSAVLGDVDGDGDPDLLLGNGLGQQNSLYLNDGNGFFTDATISHLPFDSAWTVQMRLVDLNHDGHLDLVLANGGVHTGDQNAVYLNDGTGRFQSQPFPNPVLPNPVEPTTSVAVGDVDGDGHVDLVFANATYQDRLYLNDGTAYFVDATHRLPAETDWTNHVLMADLDGDGDLDIAAATGRGTTPGVRIYLNDGRGWFVNRTDALMPSLRPVGAAQIAIADFDGDGDPDLAVNGAYPSQLPFFDPFGMKIFLNLRRQLYTQDAVRVGQGVTVNLWGDPGQLAVPAVALAPARLPLGGLGTLGLDPARGAVLPVLILGNDRTANMQLAVPPDPALRGQTLYWQALVIDPWNPAGTHLTNWVSDPIQ